jgi:hypothetical protein
MVTATESRDATALGEGQRMNGAGAAANSSRVEICKMYSLT